MTRSGASDGTLHGPADTYPNAFRTRSSASSCIATTAVGERHSNGAEPWYFDMWGRSDGQSFDWRRSLRNGNVAVHQSIDLNEANLEDKSFD